MEDLTWLYRCGKAHFMLNHGSKELHGKEKAVEQYPSQRDDLRGVGRRKKTIKIYYMPSPEERTPIDYLI